MSALTLRRCSHVVNSEDASRCVQSLVPVLPKWKVQICRTLGPRLSFCTLLKLLAYKPSICICFQQTQGEGLVVLEPLPFWKFAHVAGYQHLGTGVSEWACTSIWIFGLLSKCRDDRIFIIHQSYRLFHPGSWIVSNPMYWSIIWSWNFNCAWISIVVART